MFQKKNFFVCSIAQFVRKKFFGVDVDVDEKAFGAENFLKLIFLPGLVV